MLSQVQGMLGLGIWGVSYDAQLKLRLLPGDGLIVAVGAPYRQFVGDAVLSSGIASSLTPRSPLSRRASSLIRNQPGARSDLAQSQAHRGGVATYHGGTQRQQPKRAVLWSNQLSDQRGRGCHSGRGNW